MVLLLVGISATEGLALHWIFGINGVIGVIGVDGDDEGGTHAWPLGL